MSLVLESKKIIAVVEELKEELKNLGIAVIITDATGNLSWSSNMNIRALGYMLDHVTAHLRGDCTLCQLSAMEQKS